VGILTTRRIGILGGTFDPIHFGHLLIAEECWAQLDLSEVLFVPAGDPPHKHGRSISPATDRTAMVELAIADNPHFRLSRVDVDRPGLSYTVDTVRGIRSDVGSEPGLFFIVGQDSLLDLPKWHDPDHLLESCRIVAVNRPGYPPIDLARLAPAIPRAQERIVLIDVPAFDVAASDIRRRVAEGRPITYLVPSSVERYIIQRSLYGFRGCFRV
jgi:nicotinate-nucleotide adenylyltransferase